MYIKPLSTTNFVLLSFGEGHSKLSSCRNLDGVSLPAGKGRARNTIILKYLLTIALLIIFLPAFSQQDSTAIPEQKSIIGSVRKKLNQLRGSNVADTIKVKSLASDSLALKGSKTIDSVSVKIDKSRQSLEEKAQLQNNLDTLQSAEWGEKVIQKIDSIQDVPDLPAGQAGAELSKIEDKINKPQQFINQKTDSITSLLNRPAEVVNKKIDDALDKANNKIDSLQNRAMSTVETTENKIQGKVNKVTDGEIHVPGLDKSKITDVGIDDVSIGDGSPLKEVELGENINVDVPGLNTESLNLEVSEIKQLDINKSIDIPDANKIKELTEVKEVNEVRQQVSGELDNVDAQLAELEKYESELRKVKEGDLTDLEKRSESELMKIDAMKGLTGEAQKAAELQAQHQAMIQKYRDKKLLQEEIKRKLQNVATEKVNHLSPQFKEAQQNIATAKKKYEEVASLKSDLPKRRTNSMRGKPFYQRLLPGATLQVYNNDKVIIDGGLQIGYRFTRRLTGGLGGVYRIGISDEYEYYVQSMNVFGGRTYADWMFKKGFSFMVNSRR